MRRQFSILPADPHAARLALVIHNRIDVGRTGPGFHQHPPGIQCHHR